jgi:hypothetical protein
MHLQALSLSHKLKAVDFDILLSKRVKGVKGDATLF